jgi:nucleoside phosphorylase
MKNILIIAATKKEIENLKNIEAEGCSLDYLITGIGYKKASDSIHNVDLLKYDIVINAGIAGSLTDNYHKGDLILASKVYLEEHQSKKPIELSNDFIELVKTIDQISRVAIVTVKAAIKTEKDKRRIRKNCPEAEAVDMEAYPWAEVTDRHSIPFLILKVISDNCQKIDLENLIDQTDKLMVPVRNLLKKVFVKI